MRRHPARASSLALAAGLLAFAGAAAQQADPARPGGKLRVLVEYVGGANLYLAAGLEAGLVANDTLDVIDARGRAGTRVRVVSVAAGRAVVAFAGALVPVTRGDSLTLVLPAFRLALRTAPPDSAVTDGAARRAEPVVPAPSSAMRGAGQTAGPQRAPHIRRLPRRSARLDGSLAFDVDAMSSRSTRSGEATADPWRFVTPTVRLHATLSGLPAGMRATFNGSWARYLANGSPAPGRSDHFRLYQAEIEKAFTAVPVQVRAGRFLERHDIWGGYLDGAALRLGSTGDGAGIGVSAGLTPVGAEQSLFSGGDRASVFADYRHRGTQFGYDVDAAFTRRTRSGAPAEQYVGITQRFRLGSASLHQRARVDLDPLTGSADLTQLDLIGAIPLRAGWMARGHYSRRSFDWLTGAGVTAVQRRERTGGGLSWSGPAGSLSLDAQALRWGDRPVSPVFSGSLYLPRLAGAFGLSLNGSVNRDPSVQSAYVAPGFLFHAGGLRAEASWRAYRTTTDVFESMTQGASFSLSLPLRRGLQAALRGDFQKGGGSASQRLYTGLWAAF